MKKIQKNAARFDNLKQDFLDDKKYSGTAEATPFGEQNGYVKSKAILMRPFFDQPILFVCFIVVYQRSACRLSNTSLTTSSGT